MKRSLIEIYALAICFVSMSVLVIYTGFAIYGIIKIMKPEVTMNSWEFKRYQSNDAYVENWPKERQLPSEDELIKKREEAYIVALRLEAREGFQNIIQFGIAIILATAVFFIHWKLAKRYQKSVALVS